MADRRGLVTDDPAINAQSESSTVVAICVSFSVASVFFLALRLYTRLGILRRTGPDDITIVVAEVFALLTALGAGMEARHGLGRHTWTVSPEDTIQQLKWLYVVIVVYNFCTNLIKVSFLLQYRRLFVGERTQLVCKWALIFIGVWAVAQVLILSLACLPLATIVPSMKDRCLPVDPTWYLSSAMNIVTDFAIFLIPIPSLITLRTTGRRQKALLLVVFGLGFFTCIISIIRISYLSQRTQSKDIFWTSVTPACWSIVELHCGIICSCLATLRPLLRVLFPWLHLGVAEGSNVMTFELKYKGDNIAGAAGADDGKKGSKVQSSLHFSESTEGLREEAERQAWVGGAPDKASEVLGIGLNTG